MFPGSGLVDIANVIRVGVADAVDADSLHDVGVTPPMESPVLHVVVGGAVDGTPSPLTGLDRVYSTGPPKARLSGTSPPQLFIGIHGSTSLRIVEEFRHHLLGE